MNDLRIIVGRQDVPNGVNSTTCCCTLSLIVEGNVNTLSSKHVHLLIRPPVYYCLPSRGIGVGRPSTIILQRFLSGSFGPYRGVGTMASLSGQHVNVSETKVEIFKTKPSRPYFGSLDIKIIRGSTKTTSVK